MDISVRTFRAAAAAAGVGALLTIAGCVGARETGAVQAPMASAGQAGLPMVVSCEPSQRTIVRPTIVNGTAMSQVECVAGTPQAQPASLAPAAPVVPAPVAAPVAPAFTATPVSYRTVVPQSAPAVLDDTQVVPAATRTAAPVRTRQVVYDEPVARTRSVKKSAIVIGSSAGVGAGVGAAVGGKKGALIGAAIGGGSAAVWDQVTRRKN